MTSPLDRLSHQFCLWSESAVVSMERDEQALLTRFQRFAKQHRIYLSAGMTV
ncbi:hypothetical protein ACTWPT_20520 [Nonomuraea sp. 3N208]|uniref:hypothetical protein n=1 Tax=Nonomuraea sp. 3N208 TaxID=3457421 RepID=UPI003FCD8FB1